VVIFRVVKFRPGLVINTSARSMVLMSLLSCGAAGTRRKAKLCVTAEQLDRQPPDVGGASRRWHIKPPQ
jgi:hypothetical protein